MNAERALVLRGGDRADPNWKIGLAQEAQAGEEERLKDAVRQLEAAQAQKSIALESIMKLTRELPPRLIDFPQTHPVLREFLEENAAAIDRILELEPDSDDLEREKAATYALIGSLWRSLGETAWISSSASHQSIPRTPSFRAESSLSDNVCHV